MKLNLPNLTSLLSGLDVNLQVGGLLSVFLFLGGYLSYIEKLHKTSLNVFFTIENLYFNESKKNP